MTPQFVDTNVLLYAYGEDDARHAQAVELVGKLGRTREGVISAQVMQEFFVNVTKKVAVPVSAEEARRRLMVLGRWPVHSPHAADVVAAAELADQSQLSFWDAMIVRSAYRMGCSILWSEDLNAGQVIAGVEVRNPFAG